MKLGAIHEPRLPRRESEEQQRFDHALALIETADGLSFDSLRPVARETSAKAEKIS